MSAVVSRSTLLVTLTVCAVLVAGCAALDNASLGARSESCGPAEGSSRSAYKRSQIARSFSGGSPSAATRVVWIKKHYPCS
jgi:hypothetical protein